MDKQEYMGNYKGANPSNTTSSGTNGADASGSKSGNENSNGVGSASGHSSSSLAAELSKAAKSTDTGSGSGSGSASNNNRPSFDPRSLDGLTEAMKIATRAKNQRDLIDFQTWGDFGSYR